jgi:hypothetical protein
MLSLAAVVGRRRSAWPGSCLSWFLSSSIVRVDLDPKVLAEIKNREGLDFRAALFLCRLVECYRAANPNQPVLPMTWRMKTGPNGGDYSATIEVTSDGRSRFEATGTSAQIWDAFERRSPVEHA